MSITFCVSDVGTLLTSILWQSSLGPGTRRRRSTKNLQNRVLMSIPTAGVLSASLAMLAQKRALLAALQPTQYTWQCQLVGGASIGQHLRHSIDHYSRCLNAAHKQPHGQNVACISYDERKRGTTIETDMDAAGAEVDKLSREVKSLTEPMLLRPVDAVFMLSAEGTSYPFRSTIARELGFCTHHAIHHHAMIKIIAEQLQPPPPLPRGFGLAPSTANYMAHQ